jgi:hypothetical protein
MKPLVVAAMLAGMLVLYLRFATLSHPASAAAWKGTDETVVQRFAAEAGRAAEAAPASGDRRVHRRVCIPGVISSRTARPGETCTASLNRN